MTSQTEDNLDPIAVAAERFFSRFHPSWTWNQKRDHCLECYKKDLRAAVACTENSQYAVARDYMRHASEWLERLAWLEAGG